MGTLRTILFLALLAVLNTSQTSVHAADAVKPGFDCEKASTSVELLICGSPSLSAIDAEMAQVFSKRRAESPERERIIEEQREWLTNVRSRCENEECLEAAYRDRLAHLSNDNTAVKSDNSVPASNVAKPTEADASNARDVSKPVAQSTLTASSAGSADDDAKGIIIFLVGVLALLAALAFAVYRVVKFAAGLRRRAGLKSAYARIKEVAPPPDMQPHIVAYAARNQISADTPVEAFAVAFEISNVTSRSTGNWTAQVLELNNGGYNAAVRSYNDQMGSYRIALSNYQIARTNYEIERSKHFKIHGEYVNFFVKPPSEPSKPKQPAKADYSSWVEKAGTCSAELAHERVSTSGELKLRTARNGDIKIDVRELGNRFISLYRPILDRIAAGDLIATLGAGVVKAQSLSDDNLASTFHSHIEKALLDDAKKHVGSVEHKAVRVIDVTTELDRESFFFPLVCVVSSKQGKKPVVNFQDILFPETHLS